MMKTNALLVALCAALSCLVIVSATVRHHPHQHVAHDAAAKDADDEQLPTDHDYQIRYTRLVGDHQYCPHQGAVISMCASRDFECRMEGNQAMFAKPPSCLPVDLNAVSTNRYEINAIPPWQPCDLKEQRLGFPLCQRQFECRCRHGTSSLCFCVPPDSVTDSIGASECPDADKDSSTTCKSGDYCRWIEGNQHECAPKPYFA
ncbi:hypothetical protein PINS_up000733 [Pythium insidiosum]|nr:hypothetical protein PINS_up000733 [Pythium insidiosum]